MNCSTQNEREAVLGDDKKKKSSSLSQNYQVGAGHDSTFSSFVVRVGLQAVLQKTTNWTKDEKSNKGRNKNKCHNFANDSCSALLKTTIDIFLDK